MRTSDSAIRLGPTFLDRADLALQLNSYGIELTGRDSKTKLILLLEVHGIDAGLGGRRQRALNLPIELRLSFQRLILGQLKMDAGLTGEDWQSSWQIIHSVPPSLSSHHWPPGVCRRVEHTSAQPPRRDHLRSHLQYRTVHPLSTSAVSSFSITTILGPLGGKYSLYRLRPKSQGTISIVSCDRLRRRVAESPQQAFRGVRSCQNLFLSPHR